MQTSLPELPFPYIDPVYSRKHSAIRSTPRQYPHTDLQHLIPWESFHSDLHTAIEAACIARNIPTGTSLTVGTQLSRGRLVNDEEALRAHAGFVLHMAAEDVLAHLGVIGDFTSSVGSDAIVGAPDSSWVELGRPRLVIEYKPDWVADLMDLPHFFSQSPESRDRNARQSIEALEQIYGYATFNENKYSVLSNWKRAWFFRRAEVRGRKTLYYAKVELNSPNGSSMLKAFVGMVLIARLDWSHSSATPCTPPPSRHFSEGNDGRKTQRRAYEAAMKYSVPIKDKMYPLTPLDYRLCDFGPNWSRTSQGCVVSVSLARQHGQSHLAAICKMVDVVQSPHGGQELAYEAAVYAALSALQGTVIPHFHGYYEVWGILNLLVLEDVGNSVGDDKPLTPDLRKKMKSALACIHRLGYLHGDVARRNFCIRKGKVFVIDFERSTPSPTMAQQQAELELVDSL